MLRFRCLGDNQEGIPTRWCDGNPIWTLVGIRAGEKLGGQTQHRGSTESQGNGGDGPERLGKGEKGTQTGFKACCHLPIGKRERKQGRRLSWPGCRERSWGKRCHESQEHGAIHPGSVVKMTWKFISEVNLNEFSGTGPHTTFTCSLGRRYAVTPSSEEVTAV